MKRVTAVLFFFFLAVFGAFAHEDLSLKCVVIDAGHGGKDPGAVSKDGKTKEKTYTLDIALRLEKLIKQKYPNVKVILTRRTDTFISLDERAQIANRNNADLFISIHINSAYSTNPSGFSTHVLGQSSQKNRDLYKANLELVKRENSVVMLDDNYNATQSGFNPSDPSSYIFMTMMQNAHLQQSIDFAQIINKNLRGGPISKDKGVSQDPFYVLWKTTMPAVLVELGFISNSADLSELRKDRSRQRLAEALLNAFSQYKKQYDSAINIDTTQQSNDDSAKTIDNSSSVAKSKSDLDSNSDSEVSEKKNSTTEKNVKYGVQVFTVSNLLKTSDKRLLSYTPIVVKSGSMYKYIIGVSDSLSESKTHLETIKKKYPDAFLVKVEGEKISRVR